MCEMHFINVKHKSGLYAAIIKFIRHFIFMDVNPWIRKRKISPYFLIQKISAILDLVSGSQFADGIYDTSSH